METTQEATALRRKLHESAEVSDREENTARIVRDWLTARDIEIVADKVGGHGLVARVRGGSEGPVRLFRADLDALPLKKGGSDDERDDGHAHHACGHDGHMAMLAGALAALNADRDWAGMVYGLFQPSEETGHGGARVIKSRRLPTDFRRAFAIHNLPGVELGTVRCRAGPMACGSTGLELRLLGSTAHAAHPEAGRNPIPAIAELVPQIMRVADGLDDGAWGLVTPIQVNAGKVAYGTAAGRGVLRFTLRADSDPALNGMVKSALEAARRIAKEHRLRLKHQEVERFPATVNDEAAVAVVKGATRRAGLTYDEPDAPQRWSEDFGHFTGRWPGALIGLGSGKDQPELHTPDYEFPDDLIPRGIEFWCALAREDDHHDDARTTG